VSAPIPRPGPPPNRPIPGAPAAGDPAGSGPAGSGPDGSGPDGSGPDGSGPDGSGSDGTGPDGAAAVVALRDSVAALDQLDDLPVADHVARYDALHGTLSEALAAIDGV